MTHKTIGVAIILAAVLFAVLRLTVAHLGIPISDGVAVVGILIGSAVARGKFSATPSATKKN